MAASLRAACLAGLAMVATADGDDSDSADGDDDGGDGGGGGGSSSIVADVRTTIIVVASLVLGASCVACVLCGLRRRYNRQRASQLVRERAELALHSISAPSSPVTPRPPRPQCARSQSAETKGRALIPYRRCLARNFPSSMACRWMRAAVRPSGGRWDRQCPLSSPRDRRQQGTQQPIPSTASQTLTCTCSDSLDNAPAARAVYSAVKIMRYIICSRHRTVNIRAM